VLSTCSAAIGLDDLQRSVAIGSARAGKRATIVGREFQGADHPVPAAFPEGLYLRTLIAMVERDARLDEDAS
jgi:23S rRNA (cytosine1962-C5)-methyltransferase